MPDGRLTKYIPGRGNIVIGFKAPIATVNFIYNPVTGFCPVTNSQLKNAKEQVEVSKCYGCILTNIVDGGTVTFQGQGTIDGGIPSGSGTRIIDGGYS